MLSAATTVRLATGMNCPCCSQQIKASDIRADFGHVRLICAGCHHDILVVESGS
jgi:hypothetical protein